VQWCETGFEKAFRGLRTALEAAAWPAPPAGFAHLLPPRPMRVLLSGSLTGPDGDIAVVVKWSRPDTLADRVSHRLRGGKGAREGAVLRQLGEAGVAVPRALAFSDEGVDVLVTETVEGLRPLPAADGASPAEIEALARLLATAHGAGLSHRDLHAGNLALRAGEPILVDLGSARIRAPLEPAERILDLARLQHGLLGGTRRSQRLRALTAYLHAAGESDARTLARRLAERIEQTARLVTRHYRRGRDRRARRNGKHFALFATTRTARGVRCRDHTDASWRAHADDWLEGPPEDSLDLKAGGQVVSLASPDGAGDIVLKYFDAVASGRLPRPMRAFRRAFALQNRGIPVPQPLLAATLADGAGCYVSPYLPAPDLHAFSAGGRGGDLAALSRSNRTALLVQIGRTLRGMHEAEVSHRDLKAPNLLVSSQEGVFQIVLADLEGVRIRKAEVSWARRVRDLARLDASLDALATDRLRVLRAYYDVLPRPPIALRVMAADIARHVRHKRGPSGRPR